MWNFKFTFEFSTYGLKKFVEINYFILYPKKIVTIMFLQYLLGNEGKATSEEVRYLVALIW